MEQKDENKKAKKMFKREHPELYKIATVLGIKNFTDDLDYVICRCMHANFTHLKEVKAHEKKEKKLKKEHPKLYEVAQKIGIDFTTDYDDIVDVCKYWRK